MQITRTREESAMYTFEFASVSTPWGLLTVADVAGPPSPVDEAVPLPATV